jgi:hypothetical protein
MNLRMMILFWGYLFTTPQPKQNSRQLLQAMYERDDFNSLYTDGTGLLLIS